MGGRKDCCNTRIGTSFESKRWLSLDPCGLVGITCSFSVHAFAYITNACHLIQGSFLATAIFLLIYTPTTCMALASLYMAWTTNPGAVPMGSRPLVTVKRAASGEMMESGRVPKQRAMRRCHKCNDNFKPPRAHHDSVTGRCIVKFDHFCPWVGNAVGSLNHKFFVLFVGYTLASCIITLIMMTMRAIHCNGVNNSNNHNNPQGNERESVSSNSELNLDNGEEDATRRRWLSPLEEECEGWFQSWSVLVLLLVSFIFMIFTCCMLFEQIETIETNSSKIARMKMKVGQAGTELERVTEECNEMFGGNSNKVALHWFLPIPVEFPRGMRKAVLGYEWDECFEPVPYEEPGSSSSSNNGNSTEGGLGGNVELTPVSSSSTFSSTKKKPPPPTTTGDNGEEDNFSGTPVVSQKPANNLKQRSNSREAERKPKGTFT